MKCKKGYYCPDSSTPPIKCRPGYYTDSIEATECTICPAGSMCDRADSKHDCPSGFYSLEGASECTPCPEGFECSSTSAEPTKCAAGHYSVGFQTSCTECPAGMYCNSISGLP